MVHSLAPRRGKTSSPDKDPSNTPSRDFFDHLRLCTICENRLLAQLYVEENLDKGRSPVIFPAGVPRGIRRYFEQIGEVEAISFIPLPEEGDPDKPPPKGYNDSLIEQWKRGLGSDRQIRREFLEVAIASGSKPHQIIAFGFIVLLDWRPREMVEEGLTDWPLEGLAAKFLEDFYEYAEVGFSKEDYMRRYCLPLLQKKLTRPLAEEYPEHGYEHLRKRAKMRFQVPRAVDLTLADFVPPDTAKDLQGNVAGWADKVLVRCREAYDGLRPLDPSTDDRRATKRQKHSRGSRP